MARDTLLFRRDEARRAGWLVVQSRVRRDLRAALDALVPGERVWIFGSLTQPGRFNDASDVDVALEADRKGPRIPDPGPRSSDGARRAVTGKRSRREAIARLARLSRACQGDDRVALGDRQADVFVVSPVKLRGLTG